VRYDPAHEIIGALELLLVTLACLAVTWPVWPKTGGGFGRPTFSHWVALVCFVRPPSTAATGSPSSGRTAVVDFAWTLNIKNILAPAKLLCDPAHLQKAYGKNLAEVRRRFPMPPIEGGWMFIPGTRPC